jgi:hypothetical protein
MKVTQVASGKWAVVDVITGAVIATYDTNAEAWRAYDRLANEPSTRRDAAIDWSWNKWVGEGW